MRRFLCSAWLLVVACSGSHTIPDLGPPPERKPLATVAIATRQTPAGLNPRLIRRFQPIRLAASNEPVMARRIQLGKQLFFDARLSRDGDVSCNSCHALVRGGADDQPTSAGTGGARGSRNAPTVFNAAYHAAQLWDGRLPDIEAQFREPLLDPKVMGMEAPAKVVAVLAAVPGYPPAFAEAFPDEPPQITFEQVGRALAAFERTLVTPSRWDRFLDGDTRALTAAEIEGLRVFAEVGCVQCHTGELVGGLMFQRAGLVVPWPNQRDQGRYRITGLDSDRMVFKVPSLRNVASTAPYFHDGSTDDLDQAIEMMGTYQLGIELTPHEITAIHNWLNALSGDPAPGTITPPVLPGA